MILCHKRHSCHSFLPKQLSGAHQTCLHFVFGVCKSCPRTVLLSFSLRCQRRSRTMTRQSFVTEHFRVLWDLVRETSHNEHQVDIVCKLLATIDIKINGLLIVLEYIDDCWVLNDSILKQFAVSGFFNIQDDHGRTPFHAILERSRIRYNRRHIFNADAIKLIIKHGGDPSITNLKGFNALHIAVYEDWDTDVIGAILEGQP